MLEIVVNGAIAHRQALGGPGPWSGKTDLKLTNQGWVAARCSGPDILTEAQTPFPFQIGAHTSPHYLAEPAIPRSADVEKLRLLLEGAIGWSRLAAWSSDEVRERFQTMIHAAESRLSIIASTSIAD